MENKEIQTEERFTIEEIKRFKRISSICNNIGLSSAIASGFCILVGYLLTHLWVDTVLLEKIVGSIVSLLSIGLGSLCGDLAIKAFNEKETVDDIIDEEKFDKDNRR